MKKHNIRYEVICECGNKMKTDCGGLIQGLDCIAVGFWKGKNKNPVTYRGSNQNWRCEKCGLTCETYCGFDITY